LYICTSQDLASFHILIFAVIRVTTCGATGRTGPTAEQCAEEHNGTDIEVSPTLVLPNRDALDSNRSGIQRWTAPRGEYYTLVETVNKSRIKKKSFSCKERKYRERTLGYINVAICLNYLVI